MAKHKTHYEECDVLVVGGGMAGTGATFDLVVDGRTGTTTSVTKGLGGLRFLINESVTIASSPYHNSPLVMQITGVSSSPGQLNSPASDSPYGEITSFTVTSGNGANADTISNYSPTFVRSIGVDGGTGSGLSLDIKLDKTGTVRNIEISNGGFGYSSTDQLTIPAASLGEVDSPSNSPTTPLVIDIDSVNDTTLNGGYIRNGVLNDKPKYTLNSPTSSNTPNADVSIVYSGTEWQILRNSRTLAANNADTKNPVQDGWGMRISGRNDNVTLTSNDTPNFTVGEVVTGNASLGRATIVSSSNNVVVVKELESKYNRDEVLTGLTSGVTRTVFDMTINE